MMRLAIMQPYFFPYLGYFQLMQAVDLYIVHDRVKYVKKGWINRNRILHDGRDAVITVPIKNDSDSLDIVEREVAADFDRDKLLNRIAGAYRKAPFFDTVFPLVERAVRFDDGNLFRYINNSLLETSAFLGIGTRIVPASSFSIDSSLRGQDKVIALCREARADVYVNAIGGVDLYSSHEFASAGLELRFIRSGPFEYRQFGAPFVPSLSIIDTLMFCEAGLVHDQLTTNYELFGA